MDFQKIRMQDSEMNREDRKFLDYIAVTCNNDTDEMLIEIKRRKARRKKTNSIQACDACTDFLE